VPIGIERGGDAGVFDMRMKSEIRDGQQGDCDVTSMSAGCSPSQHPRSCEGDHSPPDHDMFFGMGPRMTLYTLRVLSAFLEAALGPLYGLEISKASGLPGATVYPILIRLEGAGWLVSEWENINPTKEGRRPRRYYRLTAEGAVVARRELEAAQSSLFSPSLRLHPRRAGA